MPRVFAKLCLLDEKRLPWPKGDWWEQTLQRYDLHPTKGWRKSGKPTTRFVKKHFKHSPVLKIGGLFDREGLAPAPSPMSSIFAVADLFRAATPRRGPFRLF